MLLASSSESAKNLRDEGAALADEQILELWSQDTLVKGLVLSNAFERKRNVQRPARVYQLRLYSQTLFHLIHLVRDLNIDD